MLLPMRVEIHDYQNNVVPGRGHFSVAKNSVVVGVIESQVIIKAESAICPPDLIETRNPIFDVSGRVPITLLELILFRIEIFLASWKSFVLTQLVSAVDAVEC